ncbi:MAG: EVE domain-containing protein [Pseudomonadales bacterium]
MAYWLVKSEPDAFSIDDLKNAPRRTEHWDGVRNYQARNYLREMARGDEVLFYHSSCPEPGVVGIAKVVKAAYPDHTAFDPDSKYFDPKSDPTEPRWFMVDLRFTRKLKRTISLAELKEDPALEDFVLLRKGNRLSVMPVDERAWKAVLAKE